MPTPKGYRAEAFWRRVDKTESCWLWTGWLDECGYGRYSTGWKHAHRVAWQLSGRELPPELDHICNVRRCVNPDHLRPTDRRTNTLRGTSPSALNVRKTYCLRGHPFTEANTYMPRPNRRQCRECHNSRERENRALAREAA